MTTSAISGNSYLNSLMNSSVKTATAASTAAASSSSSASSTATTAGSSLGQSDFLNLLIAQLKNQDPLNPMKDTEFIAQLAQFSSLQQMSSLNTTMSAFAIQQNYVNAINMVGKQITTSDGKSGVVTKVGFDSGNISIYVGENKYAMNDITGVSNIAS
jgi:flagellar basal-body rod modification protein FlgD